MRRTTVEMHIYGDGLNSKEVADLAVKRYRRSLDAMHAHHMKPRRPMVAARLIEAEIEERVRSGEIADTAGARKRALQEVIVEFRDQVASLLSWLDKVPVIKRERHPRPLRATRTAA